MLQLVSIMISFLLTLPLFAVEISQAQPGFNLVRQSWAEREAKADPRVPTYMAKVRGKSISIDCKRWNSEVAAFFKEVFEGGDPAYYYGGAYGCYPQGSPSNEYGLVIFVEARHYSDRHKVNQFIRSHHGRKILGQSVYFELSPGIAANFDTRFFAKGVDLPLRLFSGSYRRFPNVQSYRQFVHRSLAPTVVGNDFSKTAQLLAELRLGSTMVSMFPNPSEFVPLLADVASGTLVLSVTCGGAVLGRNTNFSVPLELSAEECARHEE